MGSAFTQAFQLIASGDPMLFEIIGVTLRMSLASSLTALLLGVPLGVFLAMGKSKFKTVLIVLNRTMMGLPPVVCGLLCYLMFSGVGPFGWAHLLYTVEGMIIAQVILITPIVAGTVEAYARGISASVRETCMGLRMGSFAYLRLMVGECRYEICSTYLLGLGRAMAEVGAVSMVGGAIAYKTNVMTTAIMMYTNRGDFKLAIALGIILILIFLALNIITHFLQAGISR